MTQSTGGGGGRAWGTALAELAGLLADRTRAGFCLALLDGRAWTANELAQYAGVAASTTSEHLDKLVEGGLLVQRRQGRHRYVQLADHQVAELIEDLAAAAGPVPERGHTLRAATITAALARARTCYDHLAGRLGVAITDAMTRSGLLDQAGSGRVPPGTTMTLPTTGLRHHRAAPAGGIALTDAGLDWLTGPVGIDPATLRATRRPLVRVCLDWTERRPHLAGAAGAQLCLRFHERGWIRRLGTGRAVRLTPAGETALRDLLDLDPATVAGA